jgi:PAS domain S-box-containing protein
MRLRLTAPLLLVIAVTASVRAPFLRLRRVAGRRGRAARELDRFSALSPEMVIEAGSDGYWKRVNQAVEAVLGYSEAEALSRPFMDFVHPDDRERTAAEAGRVMRGDNAVGFENRIVCKDGSYRWIAWTVTSVPEDGVMYGVGRDITERRRSESEEAALRRVATLVAAGAPPHQIFSAVSDELAQLFAANGLVLRYEEDGLGIVSVGVSTGVDIPAGVRWEFEEGMACLEVYRTCGAARVDGFDWASGSGPAVETAERVGIVSSVSNPILVENRLWGAVTVFSTTDRLADDTEHRLERFAQLVATAVANAESRDARARLADEQAALQRVATLVAQGVPPAELFSAVTREVAHVFASVEPSILASVIRFDQGPESVLVGASRSYELEPIGSRWSPNKELYASTRVFRTGRSARVDEVDLDSLGGPDAEVLRLRGFLHQVGSPVVVDGRLWGAMVLNSGKALPPDTAQRLEGFTELVATAISNAESRDAVARLADEQAALRRVATLVAEGTAPTDLFAAVAVEVAAVVGVSSGSVSRFLPDGSSVVLASHNDPGFPVGSRWRPDEGTMNAAILEAAGPARVDQKVLSGPVAEASKISDVRSAVGAPIVVEGSVWGMVAVGRQHSDESLPPQTETRLAAFTELIATAIANAESRDALARLAEEQAALRRVATLVAQGAQDDEVFLAAREEIARLFATGQAAVGRVEPDGRAVTFVRPDGDHQRVALGDLLTSGEVFRTRRSARADRSRWESAGGETAERLRSLGVVSIVSSPVVVQGDIRGVINVASTDEVLPADCEERLERFAEIVATAIANAESKEARAVLTDEQAALRRVATLVARGVPPEEVFGSVAEEVGRLFEADLTVMARYEEDSTVAFGSWSATGDLVPDGTRSILGGRNLMTQVAETGEPARMDAYDDATGEAAELEGRLAMRSSIAAPIVEEGRLWGLVVVGATRDGAFPPAAEHRLAAFTELVATAISNTEARDSLRLLAEEQAALRRVATLVARGVPPEDVFGAVSEEVGHLFEADLTVMGRYEEDSAIALGSWSSSSDNLIPKGTRSAIGGRNVLSRVAETGEPARLDAYDDATGEAADIARRFRWRSSIAAPIADEGRVWGVMLVATTRDQPFPADAEHRLAAFTDLIATAIGNADAHDEVRRFGDEQAALGRVATLVAAGAPAEEVFTAVADEASSLLGLKRIELVRYDGDTTGTVIASSGDHPFPAGTTWSLDDPSVMASVARTGRAARIDDYSGLEGEIARVAHGAGFRSAIGAPITVEGRLWGVIIAISTDPEPIPEQSEARLGQFTGLVATAVANADARHELERVAAEQAALRQVATLVAEGVSANELFSAVAQAVTVLPGVELVAMSRFDPDAARTLVAAWGDTKLTRRVGSRWALEESPTSSQILATNRPVRVDLASGEVRHGPAADLGVRSYVASPIEVEGRIWGAVSAMARNELPADTERRLSSFTKLVATAIANTESRSALEKLADEQATLRRLATLVAQGVEPEAIFTAVSDEIASIFRAIAGVMRFEHDPPAVVFLGVSEETEVPIGTRWELVDGMASAEVYRTARSARQDVQDLASRPGPVAEASRRLGIQSQVSSPIIVEGRLWGVVTVNAQEALPPDTEQRLEKFAELVTTAIANAESKSELAASEERAHDLANEQAALRRVATLVAAAAAPEVLFAAVAREVAFVTGVEAATVNRYGSDESFTVLASGNPGFPVGTRWELDGPSLAAVIHDTGRAARFDSFDGLPGVVAAAARDVAMRSAVGAPIVVDGRVWGYISVATTTPEPLPAVTERRLLDFTELVATAISNASTREELIGSRARLVTAGDEARRKIERNLHDGTQQRLVSLGLALRAAEANLPPERDDLRGELSGVAAGLAAAVEDLQEISRGIHPAILSKGGLGPALRAIAHRSPIPVDLEIATDARLDEPIEVAAYFVASEALANAAKHSQASRIDVSLGQRDGRLVLSIGDDGVGGADPARGSGLVGLTDRVEALGGSIRVVSRPGEGTQITAELPLGG